MTTVCSHYSPLWAGRWESREGSAMALRDGKGCVKMTVLTMKITNNKTQISNKYQNRNFKAQKAIMMSAMKRNQEIL